MTINRRSSKLDHIVATIEGFPATISSTIGNSIYSTTNFAVRNYLGIMKYIIDALSHPAPATKQTIFYKIFILEAEHTQAVIFGLYLCQNHLS